MTFKTITGSRLNLLLDRRFFRRGREYSDEEVKKAVGISIDELIMGWVGCPFNRWVPAVREWNEGTPLSIDKIWTTPQNKIKDEDEI